MTATTLPPAFVLGNGVNALGVVRSLGRNRVPVHLFTTSKDDLARQSRFVTAAHTMDARAPGATASFIRQRAADLGVKPALFFTTDGSLRLVSERREELSRYFHLQLPPAESVRIVTDKANFGRWTATQEFPVPRTFSPDTLEDLEQVMATARFPVVLKPTVSASWAGRNLKMVLAADAAALAREWRRLAPNSGGLLVQEYVDAPDDQHFAYYSYRTPGDGERVHVTVQKLRVYPIHGGAGAFLRVVEAPDLAAIGRAILEKLDYTGIASVCFKRSAASGEPFIYEINGRMPQCHTAFRIAGVDLPWLMYRDMIGEPVAAPRHRAAHGRWVGLSLDISAFLDYRKRGELGALRWLASYAGVRSCAEFAWDDPAPLIEFLGRLRAHVLRAAPKAAPAAPEEPPATA